MDPLDTVTTTAQWYATFAERDARHSSPRYADWAAAIAQDTALLALIDTLPAEKRQPNLVLGAARYLGIGPVESAELCAVLRERWPEIARVVARRRTQTNVPGRCATLLPALGALDGPLALLDVTDVEDLAWLDALIWPGHEDRRAQTRAAARIVAADPPLLVAGHLNQQVTARLPAGTQAGHRFVLAVDGAPRALVDQHGTAYEALP